MKTRWKILPFAGLAWGGVFLLVWSDGNLPDRMQLATDKAIGTVISPTFPMQFRMKLLPDKIAAWEAGEASADALIANDLIGKIKAHKDKEGLNYIYLPLQTSNYNESQARYYLEGFLERITHVTGFYASESDMMRKEDGTKIVYMSF